MATVGRMVVIRCETDRQAFGKRARQASHGRPSCGGRVSNLPLPSSSELPPAVKRRIVSCPGTDKHDRSGDSMQQPKP